jgi:DNA-binding CsgD family transcriptional regulator/tetratricopeptide (TPR) repeat protein
MSVDLLERDPFLLTLDELLCQVSVGRGHTALVSGEAGIGKTSLIEQFIERHHPAVRILWGACEALFTPSPLGPLYDIATQARSSLHAVLEQETNRATLFTAVLGELTDGSLPTVVVIEDIHWADEATLDLIKFLSRRIHHTSALLLLSYRDDELVRDHPLWRVLGDLPARAVTRVRLEPLSEGAVATLAEQSGPTSRSAKQLYVATGGNPFFLTEVLANDAPGVPASVRDAVLARIARLSHEAQCFLDLASVVPTKIEWRTIEAMSTVNQVWLDECLAAGMLHLENGTVGFRHELARQAVEGTLSPSRKRTLNASVLRALLESGDERVLLARLVHHAAQAEDGALVLKFAPAAAEQALAQGAHREAAAHYATALRFADTHDANQRAELLEALAHEYLLIGRMPDAIQAGEDALAIWRRLDIPLRVGRTLRWFSRVYWWLGQGAEAIRCAEAAVELLQTLPPDRELAWAYSYRAMFAMLAEETDGARLWSNRAIAISEQLGVDEVLIHTYNTLGMARLTAGDKQGMSQMELGLRLALEHNLEEHVGRVYANLSLYFVRFHHYADANRSITTGIAYCLDHDLELYMPQLLASRALAALDQGDWVAASDDAERVIGADRASPVFSILARTVLSWIRMRRGDPGVAPLLDEARDLALSTGELQRIAPVMAARAEAAWLRGDFARCAAEARVGFEVARSHANPWALGQMAIWLWRAGALTEAPSSVATPYALEMAGDWCGAAFAWERLGCPYEQALALLAGDEAAQRAALMICERLGATSVAEMARRRLRLAGARGLPRGPRPSTQANPQELTNRQLEILLLLVEGLHNSEIAARLSTTPRTVEHHVSAVLAKLHAHSRAEAVRVAYESGIIPQPALLSSSKMGA